jgi:energy-converting hydrogenase Eha subunit E
MTGKDDITQTVRFRIDQLRAGSAGPWAIEGLIDVRYGEDYRFLVEGDQYLVGAGFDPAYGALSSTVRPAEPTFGGNDVIGVDDTAVVCPVIDDPIRTLNVDGTSVNSGVLSLLFDDRRLLLATIAVPAALAFAALLAIVVLRVFGSLAMRGVFDLGRAAVTPVPDHRAVRVRRHRPGPD